MAFDPDWLRSLAGRPELLTPEEMARADAASPALGVPGPTLMANAGRAVARADHPAVPPLPHAGARRTRQQWRRRLCRRAAVAAGGLAGRRGRTRPAARGFRRRRCRVAVAWPVRAVHARRKRARAELVIDAVFGAGLARDVDGIVADALRAARRVVAVDVPSGVDGGTGAVRGYAPQAALTVTLLPAQAGASSAARPRAVRRDGARRYRLAQRRAAAGADRPASPTCRNCGACRRPGRSRTNIRAAMSPWWVARR